MRESPIPDSAICNRESGNPQFPIRPRTGIGVPTAAGRGLGFGRLRLCQAVGVLPRPEAMSAVAVTVWPPTVALRLALLTVIVRPASVSSAEGPGRGIPDGNRGLGRGSIRVTGNSGMGMGIHAVPVVWDAFAHSGHRSQRSSLTAADGECA